MALSVKAKIQWLTPESGGRKTPPLGPKYSTVARFIDISEKWPKEAWSIVAEFIKPTDSNNCTIVKLSFLVDTGPEYLLYSGSRFDLFEGPRIVATGEVI